MLGKTINNYIIEKQLGEGGMGIVYYARHNRIEREVAIKVLHANLFTNEKIRNRFKNEANALIKLNHPNIVKIFDYVEHDNFACLIMENIQGTTLDEYIARVTGPLPSAKATAAIVPVLDAVQYAHDSNIYHRDIKPGNIMISKDGNTVRIMDFGIAKLTDSADFKATHANAQLGTPFYMSPEQVKGMPYTRLSDIYSLGVTLFEMVTGKCPYQEITNLFVLQSKIVNEPLPSTNSYYPHVSQRIQNAIAIATHKIPEQRFQSCQEFKKFLLEEDKPVLMPLIPAYQLVEKITPDPVPQAALPTPQAQVVAEPVKRNNGLVYLLTLLAIIITATVIISLERNKEDKNGSQTGTAIPNTYLDTGSKIPPAPDTTGMQPKQNDSISIKEVLSGTSETTSPQPPIEHRKSPTRPSKEEVARYLTGKQLCYNLVFPGISSMKGFNKDKVGVVKFKCKMDNSGREPCEVTVYYTINEKGGFDFEPPSSF